MKGIIKETPDGLRVEYFDENNEKVKLLPLHQSKFSSMSRLNDDITKYVVGTEVEFDIVDEFTHPYLFDNLSWGDGYECAKIKN